MYFYINIFQPKVVTASDEADLVRQMEKAELENAEVAGDDDEEDEEGMQNGDVNGEEDDGEENEEE